MATARLQTFRSSNGSTYRVETPGQPLRCSEDAAWLQQQLAARGVKAYKPGISVNDPKQRKAANELVDWCSGESFKLWDRTKNAYVPSLTLGNTRLQSVPTSAP